MRSVDLLATLVVRGSATSGRLQRRIFASVRHCSKLLPNFLDACSSTFEHLQPPLKALFCRTICRHHGAFPPLSHGTAPLARGAELCKPCLQDENETKLTEPLFSRFNPFSSTTLPLLLCVSLSPPLTDPRSPYSPKLPPPKNPPPASPRTSSSSTTASRPVTMSLTPRRSRSSCRTASRSRASWASWGTISLLDGRVSRFRLFSLASSVERDGHGQVGRRSKWRGRLSVAVAGRI